MREMIENTPKDELNRIQGNLRMIYSMLFCAMSVLEQLESTNSSDELAAANLVLLDALALFDAESDGLDTLSLHLAVAAGAPQSAAGGARRALPQPNVADLASRRQAGRSARAKR